MTGSNSQPQSRFIADKILYLIAAGVVILAVILVEQFNITERILVENSLSRQESRSIIKTNLILHNGVSSCMAALLIRGEDDFYDGLLKIEYSVGYITEGSRAEDIYYRKMAEKISNVVNKLEDIWSMDSRTSKLAIATLTTELEGIYLSLSEKEATRVQATSTLYAKQNRMSSYLGVSVMLFLSSIIGLTGWAFRMRRKAEVLLRKTNQGLEETVKKRTAKIQQSQKQYKSLVENTRAIAWEVDLETLKFTYISPQIFDLTGYLPELWKDFDFWAGTIHSDDRVYCVNFCHKETKKGRDHELEYRVNTADNRIIWIRNLVTVIKEEKRPIFLRGYFIDITEHKQVEEAKEQHRRSKKMEAIGLMAGGVAHDLNNILAGITGYPELLLLQLPNESDLRQPIEAIKESGERAAAVVADLLTVARGIASTRVSVNLNILLAEYLDAPEWRQLHSQNQHIQCDRILAENLPNIFCSPVHIKKCIMNLVTNAVEAIDKSGSIILSTTTVIPDLLWAKENGLEQKKYVILSVKDTGMGISKKDIEHIFEPFYTKKVMGKSGTGLGLAVVWNTMEDHEGKIFVESSGKGTCFQLYFPVNEEEDVNQTEDSTKKQLAGNNEHILIVDDEPQLRDIASQMLRASGYKVDSVYSGESAIKFLMERPVDLIVMDMLMEPGMNGYQTYKEILELYPGQKAIIVSGFSESVDVKATIQLGAGGFLKKPYSKEQLDLAVKKALGS